MRLLRVGQPSREVPCVLDASGQARDISAIVTDISPETIPDLHRLLAQAEVTSLPLGSRQSTSTTLWFPR